MLILNRTPMPGEREIHIGNDVVVTVLQVTGQTVKIGIKAPRETPVAREELLNQAHLKKRSVNTEC